MPIDKTKYPDDWQAISRRIRFERAQSKCEWCGVPHRTYISRLRANPFTWRVSIKGFAGDLFWHKARYAVLTVHHIGVAKTDGSPGSPHDKMDCRDENLVALCNRCHLQADMPNNIVSARRTRLRKE